MTTAFKNRITKHQVREMLKEIVNHSMTIGHITVVRCVAFGAASICIVNHETQGVTYHDQISLLVAETGTVTSEWLLENGFYLLGDGIKQGESTSWLVDPDGSDLKKIKACVFDTISSQRVLTRYAA